MTAFRTHRAGIVAVFLLLPTIAAAAQPDLFDPARHMRVSEVRPGMTGFGLTVMHGTVPEKFEVEVVSILHDFNPKSDVVLIRCHGADLEHTGSIAGMSGSPIYLRDDAGHDRLIGAFAYGWPNAKDPLAGVQPIEYMLRIPADPPVTPTTENADHTQADATTPQSWSVLNILGRQRAANELLLPNHSPNSILNSSAARPALAESAELSPLATPLTVSGVPRQVLDQLAPLLESSGLVLTAGAGGAAPDNTGTTLHPGDAIIAPLLTGDADANALGTVTEVLGDRVWAFGHPFLGEGRTNLPFGSGVVTGVVASIQRSFKLGSLDHVLGTLYSDRNCGIAGSLGAAPATVPIDIHVVWTDGSEDQTYHFQSIIHPKFTPALAALAVSSALTGTRDLPQYHTVNYRLRLEFSDGHVLEDDDSAVNTAAPLIMSELSTPILAAAENPFRRVMVKRITGTLTVDPQQHQADILSVDVPRAVLKPGQTLKAFVTYRLFHGGDATRTIELPLPKDIPDGTYPLVVSGYQRYLTDSMATEPFRFTSQNINDVFNVLTDILDIKRTAIYARLVRRPDGVAVGRTAMDRLPGSRREILLDSGRSDITPFISSIVSKTTADNVIEGAAEFSITVDSTGHGQNANGHPAHPEQGVPIPGLNLNQGPPELPGSDDSSSVQAHSEKP